MADVRRRGRGSATTTSGQGAARASGQGRARGGDGEVGQPDGVEVVVGAVDGEEERSKKWVGNWKISKCVVIYSTL